MVATLAKQGSGYQIGNRRSFGAWGDVRQGATSGDPKSKYCANLGHVSDDESGLTYMRARYYEAGSGRFLSVDPEMEKGILYLYCRNNPVNLTDQSGKSADGVDRTMLAACIALIMSAFALGKVMESSATGRIVGGAGLAFLIVWFDIPGALYSIDDKVERFVAGAAFMSVALFSIMALSTMANTTGFFKGFGREIGGGLAAYLIILTMFMTLDSTGFFD